MEQKTICPKCKREVSVKAQFCPHCGSRLNVPSPGKGGAARAHLDLSTQKMPDNYIGTYRVVDIWRKEDNIYLVENGARSRFFAIEETHTRSLEQLNQLHALARLDNLAAVRNQVTDKRGNPFLIVDYVEGKPLDQLGQVGADRAIRLALQLTQILKFLHQHHLTSAVKTKPGKKPDSLEHFKKAFVVDARDKLFLFDYTAWEPMPRDDKLIRQCAVRDMELVIRTLVWLAQRLKLGQLIRLGGSQLSNLVKKMFKRLKEAQPLSVDELTEEIAQLLPSQPPPAKTIPLAPTPSARTARLDDMAAKTAKLLDKLPCGGQTDKGIVRDHNEDDLLILPMSSTSGIFAVADGMGGHAAGEVASQMAIAEIRQGATADWARLQRLPSGENVRDYLYKWIKGANEKIHAAAQAQRNNMGTTITAALILDHQVYVANVGDSRTYLFRNGELYPLTRDHSLVASLVQAGLLEADAIYDHPQRNEIFRSLGSQKDVNVDVFEPVPLVGGDRVVLCSDGLWEMVRAPQLKDILALHLNPQATCAELVRAANDKGGEDNISVIVVDIPF